MVFSNSSLVKQSTENGCSFFSPESSDAQNSNRTNPTFLAQYPIYVTHFSLRFWFSAPLKPVPLLPPWLAASNCSLPLTRCDTNLESRCFSGFRLDLECVFSCWHVRTHKSIVYHQSGTANLYASGRPDLDKTLSPGGLQYPTRANLTNYWRESRLAAGFRHSDPSTTDQSRTERLGNCGISPE